MQNTLISLEKQEVRIEIVYKIIKQNRINKKKSMGKFRIIYMYNLAQGAKLVIFW